MPRLNLVSLLYVFLALTYARHFSPIIPFYLPILIRLSHSYSLQAINCSNRYQNYTSDLPAPRKTSCARTSTTAMWASAVQPQQQHPHPETEMRRVSAISIVQKIWVSHEIERATVRWRSRWGTTPDSCRLSLIGLWTLEALGTRPTG